MTKNDRLHDKSPSPQRGRSIAKAALPPDPPPASPPASQAGEQEKLSRLRCELARLRSENHELQIALLASNEQRDVLQEQRDQLSASLTVTVREREGAEERLQKLIQAVTREKGDLEILVQILMDQGDDSAEEGEKARIDGLTRPNSLAGTR
jgi:chromosome segregation ATPase